MFDPTISIALFKYIITPLIIINWGDETSECKENPNNWIFKWNKFGAQFILSIFITLYVFRTTMCPSSGETTVFMQHLLLVTLCGWLSGMRCGMSFSPPCVPDRVDFGSCRMSYIVLRSRWRNIIVLIVHAPSEEKGDDSKDSLYEELEYVFDHFATYHQKSDGRL